KPVIYKIFLTGIFIASASQLCGINIIFYYSDEIFRGAGYGVSDMLFNILFTGSINLIFTFVAIGVIDIWCRRKLMLSGLGVLSFIHFLLEFLFLNHYTGVGILIAIIMAIAVLAMTIGPGTWVLLSEIFPISIRGLAMAI